MQIVVSLLSLLLFQAESKSWGPKRHDVFMKDFLNSRNLPIATVSGTSGYSPSRPTATNSNLSDDVARGGHASVKVGQEQIEQEELGTQTDSLDTKVVAADTVPTSPPSTSPVIRSSHGIKAIAVDLTNSKTVESGKGRKKKNTSSAARIAKKLRNRNHTNVRRKIMHAAFGLCFAALNYVVPKKTFVPIMVGVSTWTLLVELLRYRKEFQWMNDIIFKFVGKGLRKHEMEGKFSGSLYFCLGVTLTAWLYSKPCSTLAICQLALADPSASYFGTKTKHVYWSRIENGLGGFGRNKGILGFLGGAIFCIPFNYRLLSLAKFAAPAPAKSTLALASLAFGLAGAFADLAVPTPVLTLPKRILGRRVPPFHVDDNFVVPIFSGFACTQVFKALGWDLDLELSKFLFL